MNLETIRSFLAIVEDGSLNRAAERLHLSQSTLTRQIQALEREIGGRLLERTPGGVSLTSVGHTLRDKMKPLLKQFDGALHDVRGVARGQSSSLRIGYLGSASSHLNKALETLRTNHPTVKVSLHDLSPGEQIEALKKWELDVGIVGHAGILLSRDFHTRRLCTYPILVAMAQSHPLAKKTSIGWDDLRHELFMSADERDLPGYDRWIMQQCRKAGFKARFQQVSGSLAHAMAMLVSDHGVSLQPGYMADNPPPGIVLRPLRDTSAKWEMYVAWPRGLASVPLREFIAALPRE